MLSVRFARNKPVASHKARHYRQLYPGRGLAVQAEKGGGSCTVETMLAWKSRSEDVLSAGHPVAGCTGETGARDECPAPVPAGGETAAVGE